MPPSLPDSYFYFPFSDFSVLYIYIHENKTIKIIFHNLYILNPYIPIWETNQEEEEKTNQFMPKNKNNFKLKLHFFSFLSPKSLNLQN